MLCQSCRFCADGTGGNRRCYLDIDNPLRMTSIPFDERENCKYYRHDDEPSWKKYEEVRCPICDKRMIRWLLGNGCVQGRCDHCGYRQPIQ